MTNDLDDELYCENDDLIRVAPMRTQVNSSTGVLETIALSGRTDGVAFLSTSSAVDGTASPIHATLSKTLTEVGVTGVYWAVMEGSDKTTQLAALADGTVRYRHFAFGADYHEVKAVTVRKSRVAA